MSQVLDLKNPSRAVRVGVILMNGTTEIQDVAPIDVLHGMSKKFTKTWPDDVLPKHIKEQAFDMEFIWVSQHGAANGPMKLTSGINLVPTHSFADCPTLDIVLIGAHMFDYTPNEAEVAFVRRMHDTCAAFLTICGGVDLAIRAGLLEGKTATGPRLMLPLLRQQAPGANWVERRWARDGKVWTSGTLLNGLDLMRAFATETWGGGEDTLMGTILQFGSVPNRDVDYKDEPLVV